MRVFGYVRVSTQEQVSGHGPEVQAKRIEAYAAQAGLDTPEISYESKSGESVIPRLELHSILSAAEDAKEAGDEAHIIISSLDRLTRNLTDQETVALRCFNSGVRLHSAEPSENQTLDPQYAGDPMRTAIRQFFGIFHQLDKSIIQRRLDGGLTRKGIAGGFTGGRTPFGYMADNKEMVIDPAEAPIVRRVLELSDAGINLSTIAGVVAGEYPICAHWRPEQIRRIINKRRLYRYGEYRSRAADIPRIRPELIIAPESSTAAQIQPAAQMRWEAMPKEIAFDSLVAILGVSAEKIRLEMRNTWITPRLRGQSLMVPRDVAQELAQRLKQKPD